MFWSLVILPRTPLGPLRLQGRWEDTTRTLSPWHSVRDTCFNIATTYDPAGNHGVGGPTWGRSPWLAFPIAALLWTQDPNGTSARSQRNFSMQKCSEELLQSTKLGEALSLNDSLSFSSNAVCQDPWHESIHLWLLKSFVPWPWHQALGLHCLYEEMIPIRVARQTAGTSKGAETGNSGNCHVLI